jgi:AraC-like DNA-binding protein
MDNPVPMSRWVSVACLQGLPDYLARQAIDSVQLPEVGAGLEQIAARLALSPRTLQRHLREAGLSFTRCWIKRASNGCCAPRRWTGQGPGESRRGLKEH